MKGKLLSDNYRCYRYQYPQAVSLIDEISSSVIQLRKQTEVLSRLSPIAIVSDLSLNANTMV